MSTYNGDPDFTALAGTEAEAVARIVREANTGPLRDKAGSLTVATPPGWNVKQVDLSHLEDRPARSKGSIEVFDAASFLAAVEQRTLDGRPQVAYADEDAVTLVAILDDDTHDLPGWRQYRVQLALRPTPEWLDWKGRSEVAMRQEPFAEFIEEHARDFRTPTAADMLELASTIEGTKSATFKGAVRLKTGARQVGWSETVEARAGQTGQLEIPDRFLIGVRPFIGSEQFEVEAWLRLRIVDGGHLQLSFKLDRADRVEKAVFDDVLAAVEASDTGLQILRAPAPT